MAQIYSGEFQSEEIQSGPYSTSVWWRRAQAISQQREATRTVYERPRGRP